MEIKKFKKDKGNTYKIYFDDDNVISLYDDVIVKYNLLSNKVLDKDKFNEIVGFNDFLDGYYKSIKYINKKLRSEAEIEKYLNKLDVSDNDIKKIIKLLYDDGYLNKERFLKAFINDKYNLSNYGPNKIIKDLTIHGYNVNDINMYLDTLDWYVKINKLVDSKIKTNHKLSNNSLKNKILREIINLGYEKNMILEVLNKKDLGNDYLFLEKELVKIKKKYSNKYSGNELEYKVINYLYKKGFDIENIKRCYDEN